MACKISQQAQPTLTEKSQINFTFCKITFCDFFFYTSESTIIKNSFIGLLFIKCGKWKGKRFDLEVLLVFTFSTTRNGI